MKKIITLFFCTALFATSFAQSRGRDWDNNNAQNRNGNYQNDRDRDGIPDRYDRNNTTYQNNGYTVEQRDMQIQRVVREYDYKIQQVNYDRSMSRREKKNTIKALESQKINEINRINAAYNNNNVYNNNRKRNYDKKNYDHDNRYDRYNR